MESHRTDVDIAIAFAHIAARLQTIRWYVQIWFVDAEDTQTTSSWSLVLKAFTDGSDCAGSTEMPSSDSSGSSSGATMVVCLMAHPLPPRARAQGLSVLLAPRYMIMQEISSPSIFWLHGHLHQNSPSSPKHHAMLLARRFDALQFTSCEAS